LKLVILWLKRGYLFSFSFFFLSYIGGLCRDGTGFTTLWRVSCCAPGLNMRNIGIIIDWNHFCSSSETYIWVYLCLLSLFIGCDCQKYQRFCAHKKNWNYIRYGLTFDEGDFTCDYGGSLSISGSSDSLEIIN